MAEIKDKPKKEIKKVVTGSVSEKKKSSIQKAADNFISEDAPNVFSYIFTDIVIPTVKDLLAEMGKSAIDMIFYGGETSGGSSRNKNRSRGSSSRRSSYEHIDYMDYYDERERRRVDHKTYVRSRRSMEFLFETRADAEEVLFQMYDILDRYNVVSVLDFYQLVGKEGTYTDDKYGWMNLDLVKIKMVRDGHLLMLPKPLPFD